MPKSLEDLSLEDLEALRAGDYEKASLEALETWKEHLSASEDRGMVGLAARAAAAPVQAGVEAGQALARQVEPGSPARAAVGAVSNLIPGGLKRANAALTDTAARLSESPGRAADAAVKKVDDALTEYAGLDGFEKLGALADLGGKMAARAAVGATREQLQKVGYPEEVLRPGQDVASGAIATAEGVAGSLRALGLERSAGFMAQAAKNASAELMPMDPGFSDHVAAGFGSMAVFMVPGYGIQVGSAKLAGFSWRLANVMGVGASSVLESATEAGSVYNEVLAKTGSKDEALRMGNAAFFANLPVTGITNMAGPMSPEARTMLGGIWQGAANEGSQEFSQQLIQNAAQGDPITEGLLLSFGVGAVTGGGIGGIQALSGGRPVYREAPGDTGAQPRSIPTLPPPAQPPQAAIDAQEAAWDAGRQGPPQAPSAPGAVEAGEAPVGAGSAPAPGGPLVVPPVEEPGLEGEVVQPPGPTAPSPAESWEEEMGPTDPVEAADEAVDIPIYDLTPKELRPGERWTRAEAPGHVAYLDMDPEVGVESALAAVVQIEVDNNYGEGQTAYVAVLPGEERIPGQPEQGFINPRDAAEFAESYFNDQVGTTVHDEKTDPPKEVEPEVVELPIERQENPVAIPGETVLTETGPGVVERVEEDGTPVVRPKEEVTRPPLISEGPGATVGEEGDDAGESSTAGPGPEWPGGVRQPGPGPLEGAPSGEGGGAAPEGGAAGGPEGGRGADAGADERGDQPAGEERPEAGPGAETGVGADRPAVHPAGTGSVGERLNHEIKAEDNLGAGGKVQKFNDNLAAIKTLKAIEAEGRKATAEEQSVMARYVGWGSLANEVFRPSEKTWWDRADALREVLTEDEYDAARATTPNAHYTSISVVRAMWAGMERLGFKGGRLLEPSMGTGNFFGAMPRALFGDTRMVGVEIDSITGRIARQLYQSADVRVTPFEKAHLPLNFFDAVVGNVPFGNYSVFDKKYAKTGMTKSIHNYFFAKSIDATRPGGLLMLITSHHTMDSLESEHRKFMAERADLVAAFRLSNAAFKQNAGTEVVTDVIILRKKGPGLAPIEGVGDWVTAEKRVDAGGQNYYYNNYFKEHPENVLGKESFEGTRYRENSYTVEATDDPERTIEKAMARLPEGLLQPVQRHEPKPHEIIPAEGTTKQGGYVLRDGKIFRKVGDVLEPADDADVPRLKALLGIRDAIWAVFKSQLEETSEKEQDAARAKLNKLYDAYVKKWGDMRKAARAMEGDPDYHMLRALEKVDAETGAVTKADIFTKRVMAPLVKEVRAGNPKEALAAVLNETGKADLKRMAELTGIEPKHLRDQLRGLVYDNPEGGLETADAYLSGNVKQKLAAAKLAARTDEKYKENVTALEAVQPIDLKPIDIEVELGSPWVDGKYISDFIEHLTDVAGVEARFIREAGSWVVEPKRSDARWRLERSAGNTTKWGTRRMSAVALVKASLDGNPATVTDPHPTDDRKRVVNQKETEYAREKQEQVKDEFKRWVFLDAARRDALVKYYNDNFNVYRSREYNGSHMTLPGLNPALNLMKHQIDGAWRVVASAKNTLLAHVVGAGKTYTMIVAAMEMRRLGIARKPLFVVPKVSLGQWEDAFRYAYPAAKILMGNEKDFEGDNRRVFMSRIATGDWDAVIVTHPSFSRLRVSPEFIQEYFNQLLAEIESAIESEVQAGERRSSPSVKDLEKMRKRLQAKMEELTERYQKDLTVSFEEMGIDHLFVDEAHEYKNLLYVSAMRQVSGLGNKNGSGRALDLYLKTRYLNRLRGGKGVTFATGTPISNTIAEMYHMLRYLDEDTLRDSGLTSFDAWAKTFGKTVTKVELAIEGGNKFISKTRFAKFQNVQEMLRGYMEVADIKGAADLKLPRPKLKGGKARIVEAPRSPDMDAYFQELVRRAEKVRSGEVDPSEDNLLKISTDGRKAALDVRLVMPTAADDDNSKVNTAVKEIFKNWESSKKEKLTQLVFADLGTPSGKAAKKETAETKAAAEGFGVYSDMKRKLVALGVPPGEIAFIHEAKTKEARKRMFALFNQGKIRIMLGSSGKMATAANVQTRLKWLHHLDPAWRPDIVEQREGRILRQGNTNEEVEIVRYVTLGSFDVNMWQILENKAGFLGQLNPRTLTARSLEDVEDISLGYEEVKSAATGNPKIKEKFEVENRLRRMRNLKAGWLGQRYDSEREMAELPARIESIQSVIKSLKEDVGTLAAVEKAEFSAKIGDDSFEKREQFGEALLEIVKDHHQAKRTGWHDLGRFKGQPFGVFIKAHGSAEVGVKLEMTHYGSVSESGVGTVQSLEHAIKEETVKKRIKDNEDQVEALEKRVRELKKELEGGFEKEAEIEALEQQKALLDKELGIGQSDGNAGTKDESEEDEDDDGDGGGSAAMRAAPTPAPRSGLSSPSRAKSAADRGVFVSPFPVELGGMGLIKPVEMPELYKIVKELTGKIPEITKRLRVTLGQFKYREGDQLSGVIQLKPEVFKDPQVAAAILAHEIGHANDFYPELTLQRGNLLGRIGALKGYLKDKFGNLTVTNKTLRKELVAVTEFWRPYDKKTAPGWFVTYRNSSAELYADAISVLLNSPGTLERMAPNFYRELFAAMDKKPQFKDLYFQIQDQLSGRGPDIKATRQEDVRLMFAKAQEAAKLKAQKRQLTSKDIRIQLRQQYDDINYPLRQKVQEAEARGAVLPADQDPYLSAQEADMVDNDVNLLLYRFNSLWMEKMAAKELTQDDLGALMLFERIGRSAPGDRIELANPLGHVPKTALDQLEYMRSTLGAERFGLLEEAAAWLRQENFKMAEEAARVGLYDPKVFEEKILPNRSAYATFQVIDYIQDRVSAGIKKQIGTLKDVNNPVLATMMKMIALRRALAEHKAKTDTVAFLKEHYAGEIEEVKPVNPQDDLKQFRAPDGNGIITVQEEGRMKGYAVDPYIAKIFENGVDPVWNNIVLGILRWTNNSILHPLLIVYNPGYQAFNLIRDFKATWHNNPQTSLAELLKAYWKAIPTAKKRAAGIYDATMEEMLANKALGTPINDIYMEKSEDQYERILEKHHVQTGRPQDRLVNRIKVLKPVIAALEFIRRMGEITETIPKVADYNLRKHQGEQGRKLAYNTRTYAGTPNIFVRGEYTQTANAIFIYSRAMKEGLKRDLQVATNPTTRSGFWFKVAMSELAPKFLMAFLAYAAGDWWKEWWDRVSEYDKTNYIIVPLGYRPGGNSGKQAVYLRVPHDEVSRLISSVAWKILSGVGRGSPQKLLQVFDVTANQLPGLTPALTIPQAWLDYVSGRNPYDRFRGRNVISDVEFKAGGYPALKKMVWWTANSLGVVRLSTYDPSQKSIYERVVEVTPVLNRLVRVTDYGLEEEARGEAAAKAEKKAELYLDRSDSVRRLVLEESRLSVHDRAGRLSDQGKEKLRLMRRIHRSLVVPFERKMAEARDAGDQRAYNDAKARLEQAVKRTEARWNRQP